MGDGLRPHPSGHLWLWQHTTTKVGAMKILARHIFIVVYLGVNVLIIVWVLVMP